jgi:hypothetical protein
MTVKPIATILALAPGLLTCAIIVMAATFVSEHHGGPLCFMRCSLE